MRKISLILCTHNPREDYLRRTLSSLEAQTLALDEWDLLIVDNASTSPVAESVNLSWHPQARCVREDEVGLTPARLRGIREAAGDLLVFADDDNVLRPDYLAQALATRVSYPFLGAFGAGVLEPEFEVPPSPVIAHVLQMLALRTVGSVLWSNNPLDGKSIPWGAGLCVTRTVADHYLELVRQLNASKVLDRRGAELFCGGDDLFAWAAAALGLGFGIFPELGITHLISASRLEQPYLLRLVHDHSFSHGVLRFLLAGAQPASLTAMRCIHVALHGLRNGQFSMRCHWAAAQGEGRAGEFVRQNQLRPLPAKSA